jgi:xylose isomerase
VETGTLASLKDQRYAGWDGPLGAEILEGRASLADLADRVQAGAVAPVRHSGRQEYLENVVNRSIWRVQAGAVDETGREA